MVTINLKSTLWFLSRPGTYRDYAQKVCQAISKLVSGPKKSTEWCESKAVGADVKDLIVQVTGDFVEVEISEAGRSTNGILLYNLAEYLGATRVIETGVCKGYSSFGLLESLKKRNGRLISTDIPLPEKWVDAGCVVPEELKGYWELIQLPDRVAIPQALEKMPEVDLCYYDSDKSYAGRMFAYRLLWKSLRKGGIFVSDDIGDNYGFKDFCEAEGLEAIIVKNGGRYVGVIVKK